MKKTDRPEPKPWQSTSQFDKPPASSFGEAFSQRANRSSGVFEGLATLFQHGGLELVIVVLFAAGFWVWTQIEKPVVSVTPLSEEDEAMLAEQRQWPVVIDEDFTGGEEGSGGIFAEDVDETAYRHVNRWVEDGRWNWVGDFQTEESCCRGFSAWYFPQDDLTDFWLSVDFTRVDGDEGAMYGVVYHYQDIDNFYIARANDIGNGGIEVWGGGKWEALLTPGSQPAKSNMYPGKPNTFQISVQDGKAIIFLNGVYLGQYTDDRVPAGRLGIILPKPYDGGHIEIAIDNIELRAP